MGKYLDIIRALEQSTERDKSDISDKTPTDGCEPTQGNSLGRINRLCRNSHGQNGSPHPRYGDDEFSLIRLPRPAIIKRTN